MVNQQLKRKNQSGRYLNSFFDWSKKTLILSVIVLFYECKPNDILNSPNPELPDGAEKQSAAANAEFTIVVMPDTQHYFAGFLGGKVAMFNSQINWIRTNKAAHNIVYVAGVGDIVEHGDNPNYAAEWTNAANNGYYKLELDGIPYGLAVGNHDQGLTPYTDWGHPINSPTKSYNSKFGVAHFNNAAHPYWRGHYGTNNDSHYDFFRAGEMDFMVIYIEYDSYNADRSNMSDWARSLCLANPNRKVIVVTHYMMNNGLQNHSGGTFSAQGEEIYNKLKEMPNVFMFLGGHISGAGPEDGEGYREDTFDGRTIRTYLSDYQNRENGGGHGRLRLLKFSVDNDDVSVKTYSPYTNTYDTDLNSQFTKPLFGAAPTFQVPAGKYKIIARHSGQALVVDGASTENNAGIIQYPYADNGVNNDQWNLIQTSTPGYYRISNVHSNKDMVIKDATTEYGSGNKGLAIQWSYSTAYPWNDEWALIPVGEGYYKIIARHSGLCLNVAGGNNTPGALLKQWKYLGTDNILNDQFQLVPIP